MLNQDDTTTRPNGTDVHNDPTRGLAGKIQATQATAPEHATEQAIIRVAREAFERDCHPKQVWESRSRENERITDYSGGEADG
jgi:hypothetical protein